MDDLGHTIHNPFDFMSLSITVIEGSLDPFNKDVSGYWYPIFYIFSNGF